MSIADPNLVPENLDDFWMPFTPSMTKEFSKQINREILTLSTVDKKSVSKIKAKLISYVS